jgi:hypothetical protein
LNEDPFKVAGQNWVCFSFIQPEDYNSLHHSEGQYQGNLIKFSGAFATREEADTHIRELMKRNPHFDVHMIPAFRWAAAGDTSVDDNEYVGDDRITDCLKGYFKQENNRMMGVKKRIEMSSINDGDQVRSDESTSFFDEAQKRLKDHNIDTEHSDIKMVPTSLDDLAKENEIEPNSAKIMSTSIDLDEAKVDLIVAEELLATCDDRACDENGCDACDATCLKDPDGGLNN